VSRRAFSVVFLVIKLFDILKFIPLLMIAFNIKRSDVLKKEDSKIEKMQIKRDKLKSLSKDFLSFIYLKLLG
jgi:hypothetical protein